MDYEQRYKQAIEKIRKGLQPLSDGAKISGVTKAFLEEVFPELAESKDEKVRKALITFFQRFPYDSIEQAGTNAKEAIAWLEKQGQEPKKVSIWKHWKNGIAGNGEDKPIYLIKTGYTYQLSSCLSFECDYIELSELDNLLIEKQVEKKTIDKVEPKFKVGDWIVDNCNNMWQVVEVSNNFYRLKNINESESLPKIKWVNETFHLWSVKDAKDGDMLACGDKVTDCPFIFHNLTEKQNPRSYCGIDTLGEFQVNDENGGFWCYSNEVRPATKEQRDLLFSEMKEAGYEWNPDKKELKKIEDEIEIPFGAKDSELQEVTYYIPKGFHAEIDDDKVVIKKGEKTAEWSEDDEEILKNLIDYFSLDNGLRLPSMETIDWLKSLKERING